MQWDKDNRQMTPEEEAMSKDREIAASEARLRMIINVSPDAVMVLSSAGIIFFANPAAERLFERPATDMVGTEFGFLVLGSEITEIEVVSKSGVLQTAEMRLADIEWEREKAVLLTLRDITKRKQVEEALQHSAKQYLFLFNSIRDAILVADNNRTIIDCNPAFLDLFGYSKEAALGKQTLSMYENEEEFRQMGTAIKDHYGDPGFLYTVRYQKEDGSVFPGETNVFYLKNDTGTIVGFIGLIRDITERKLAQEQQDRLIADLQKTLAEVKTLRGFLPICSYCKKIRDDNGYWSQIEAYIRDHSEAEFSHGICEECAKKYYPDIDLSEEDDK